MSPPLTPAEESKHSGHGWFDIPIAKEDDRTSLIEWVKEVAGMSSTTQDRSELISWLLNGMERPTQPFTRFGPIVADLVTVVRTLGTAEDAVVRLARVPNFAILGLWSSVMVILANQIIYFFMLAEWWRHVDTRTHVKARRRARAGARVLSALSC